MEHPTSSTPFLPGRTRARVTIILLGAGAFLAACSIINSSLQLTAFPEVLAAGAEGDDVELEGMALLVALLDVSIAVLSIIVFVATVVAFSMWIHRAYKNLPALGNARQALDASPGWAVGYFFVPILNLFRPYQVVKEIWRKSTPVAEGEDPLWASSKEPSGLIGLWWGLWLISNFADRMVFNYSRTADTPEEMATVAKLLMFTGLLDIAAAVLAILVVKGIDKLQTERSRQVTYLDEPPPLPPTFNAQAGQTAER